LEAKFELVPKGAGESDQATLGYEQGGEGGGGEIDGSVEKPMKAKPGPYPKDSEHGGHRSSCSGTGAQNCDDKEKAKAIGGKLSRPDKGIRVLRNTSRLKGIMP
jgi:hypothetical protein